MYTDEFYVLEGEVARRSAEIVIPWVLDWGTGLISTVIDIGCGTGEWLAVAQRNGCDVFGVDGFVPGSMLQMQGDNFFHRADISGGWPCGWFHLAICLEVAEHLPPESAEPLVAGLAEAEIAILFSAATPGQPGIGHINCQPHDYWHDLFGQHGKTPEFIGDKFTEPVADFYRRNMFLYR